MTTGGCQCGAVRIEARGAPVRVLACHCRMCQRATGNAFAPLAEFAAADVTIEGEVATWASSNVSERGFCPRCGTPLFLRDRDGNVIELMVGAMAEPGALAPAYHYGVEGRVGWLEGFGDLPAYRTGHGPDEYDGPAIESRQAPERRA